MYFTNIRKKEMLDLVTLVEYGDAEKVKEFLSIDGINPNVRDNYSGQTPLHLAVDLCLPEIVKQLMMHPETNPYTFNTNGFSPFHQAVYNQDEECVELILNSNKFVDINLRTRCSNRQTVLHMTETEEILRLLLTRSDLMVNIKDARGQTPLHLFSYRRGGECEDVTTYFGETLIPILLEERPDVDPFLLDKAGKSAYDTAQEWERVEYGEYEKLTMKETILEFQQTKYP